MILGAIITGAVGILCLVLGFLIWKKEKISLLHDYHYAKVKQEDRKAFCRLAGIGIITLGTGILAMSALILITDSPLSAIAFGVGLASGVSVLIYAEKKYNR